MPLTPPLSTGARANADRPIDEAELDNKLRFLRAASFSDAGTSRARPGMNRARSEGALLTQRNIRGSFTTVLARPVLTSRTSSGSTTTSVDSVAELRKTVDHLEAENAQLRSAIARINTKWELRARVDHLRHENAQLGAEANRRAHDAEPRPSGNRLGVVEAVTLTMVVAFGLPAVMFIQFCRHALRWVVPQARNGRQVATGSGPADPDARPGQLDGSSR